MSIYISDDTGEPMSLASNKGWSDFGAWVDSIDADQFPDLVHLWEHGWSEPAGSVRDDLAKAIERQKPKDETVIATARGLLEWLDGVDDDAALAVNNGIAEGEAADE